MGTPINYKNQQSQSWCCTLSLGLLYRKKTLKYIDENFTNTETKYVGKGKHYIQEDIPKEIGESIDDWLKTMND